MAKKTNEPIMVDCQKCAFGGAEVVNHLLDCNNKERNPMNYKVGCWLKECKHYKEKKP